MKKSKTIIAGTLIAGAVAMQSATRSVQSQGLNEASLNESIRPFTYQASESDLDDLRRRILATKFPEKETVSDFSQGVPLTTIKQLADYWANGYDWRKIEAKINSYPNFITTIDGLDIHFIHVRSNHKGARPILISHGWPGSIVEQLKLIDPLTNPTAHGGTADDAFDVIIPSMPGYGFSAKPISTGWNPQRIARAWDVLMTRLGYNEYFAQGGDWGAIIVDQMGVQAPKGLVAIHTNMACVLPADLDAASLAGKPVPTSLSGDEKHAYEQVAAFYKDVYYAFFMGTRPQTLVGLTDSPVGLATFMIDHDRRSLELIARIFNGQSEGLTRDDVLDNVTLFWLTNTAVSAARLYWENKLGFFTPKGVKIPVAVSAFPDELFQAPKSWAEKAYPNLIFYNKHDKGGHFAAWEQPTRLVSDLRAAFSKFH